VGIEAELAKLQASSAEQVEASRNLVDEVSKKTKEIDDKVNQATTVVRDTIKSYNSESYYIDTELGDNSNSGKSSNDRWKDLGPLKDKLVYGKAYNIYIRGGQEVAMPHTLRADNVVYLFKSEYDNPAKIIMQTIDYVGVKDGTVSFAGHNQVVKLYGVILETATLPPESTGRSTSYESAAFSRVHGAANLNIELYRGGIDIKDFPLIRTAHQNAGMVNLNLGATSKITISEGGESHLAYTNDHLGLSNGTVSSIDNAHGANTWNAILSGVGGNSNVLADFDFEAQV